MTFLFTISVAVVVVDRLGRDPKPQEASSLVREMDSKRTSTAQGNEQRHGAEEAWKRSTSWRGEAEEAFLEEAMPAVV